MIGVAASSVSLCLTMGLVFRAGFIWLLLLFVAVGNGVFRQKNLLPILGDSAAHVVSTVLLCVMLALVAGLTFSWLEVVTRAEAWRVGAMWAGLTLGFEFLGGHFLFHAPWSLLLADYNLLAGRIWILVPVLTFLLPRILFGMAHR